MSELFYITAYSRDVKQYHLKQYPAGATKSEYILSALKQITHTTLVSVTYTLQRKFSYVPYSMRDYDENETDILVPSVGAKLRLFRGLNAILPLMGLCWVLLYVVKKDDIVIAYHSLQYDVILRLTQKIRGFYLILEMEEIYADVTEKEQKKKRELAFASEAKGLIVPTLLLNRAVNAKECPYLIVHGTYQVEQYRNCKFCDGKIHVVYAGTLDPRKGGSTAAAAAQYLDKNYHVHVLGFGSDADKKELQEVILKTEKNTECTVTYDGCLSGEEYIRFIQSCDIGLSTQNPDAAFNATSFPSKILSYMANGLRVVSVRIPAIETSAIGDYMYYYDHQTPEEIARAIKGVRLDDGYDGRKVIYKLDRQFNADLLDLIEAVKKNEHY